MSAQFANRVVINGRPNPSAQDQSFAPGTLFSDDPADVGYVYAPSWCQGSKSMSPKNANAQTLQLTARAADIDQYTLQWTLSGLAVPSGLSAAVSADWDVDIS
jgi:hypothetical protein